MSSEVISHEVVFTMQVTVLIGFASIAAVFCGFIGLVKDGMRSRKESQVEVSENTFHFLYAGLSTLFLSIATAVALVCLSDQEDLVWRLANAIAAGIHGRGTLKFGILLWHQPKRYAREILMFMIGSTITVVTLLAAISNMTLAAESFILLLSQFWCLCVTVISFVDLIHISRRAPH
jgi:hypothetical protein